MGQTCVDCGATKSIMKYRRVGGEVVCIECLGYAERPNGTGVQRITNGRDDPRDSRNVTEDMEIVPPRSERGEDS